MSEHILHLLVFDEMAETDCDHETALARVLQMLDEKPDLIEEYEI